MDFNQFYILSEANLKGSLCVSSRFFKNLEDYKLFRGEIVLESPIQFKNNLGKKTYHVIATGFPGLYLFHETILTILTLNKITGWKTYPCDVYDWNNNKIEGYSIFSVLGRCSAIDYSKSEKIMIQPFTSTGQQVEGLRGLYFEHESWDGSDIFTPENTMLSFVNEKVKKLFEEHHITNVNFKKITEFEK